MKTKYEKLFSLIFIITIILAVPCFHAYATTNSTNEIKSIRISLGSVCNIGLEESVQIRIKDQNNQTVDEGITYSSNNKNIITIDAKGKIQGKKTGTATITAKTNNGKKATCKITVGKKPTSIKITNSNTVIQKDSDNHKISYTLSKGANSYKITYSVKNKNIATVDSNGYITGRKKGKTSVTIKTYNNKTATQNITITDDSLTLNVNSTQIALDHENVEKVKYGTSVQGRNLEAFVISNAANSGSLNQECKIKANGTVNIRSGPGTAYSIIASLKNGTKVTRIEKAVKKSNGYKWDKIVLSNKKTGYVATNYLQLIKDNTVKPKTLFIDFAIHGFEDEYYRDGQALVHEANALIEYFADHSSELKNYKLIIVPCVNPDGTIAGKNNQRACATAFGRCTSKHIDMNRDWGNFKALETQKLKNYITKVKPDFYLNVHGWLDETIGDSSLNTIVRKQLGLSKQINNYPSTPGYAIDWVHKNLKIPATLVEYRSSASVSTTKDISMIKSIIASNGKTTVKTSAAKFPSPVDWKNGSTAEPVYRLSNLTEKTDSIKAKGTAKCYRKSGSAYVLVYSASNNKHKTGFVKYAGGVKNPPTQCKTYKNGSTSETVYADTGKKTKIGSLDAKESCQCLGKIDGMYLVIYNVSGSKQKCGFVSYSGGC